MAYRPMLLLLAAMALSLSRSVGQALVPAATPTLVDHAIASGSAPVYLDGAEWSATNDDARTSSLQGTVPGDIITDLQSASRVADPYWNITWRDPSFIANWNAGTWTYTRRFKANAAMREAAETLLVFDGIRMGATIALNGAVLGNATDQFLRYEFPVRDKLAADNVLTVTFHKDIACGGRYTYSSQIDWAPNFVTFDPAAPPIGDAQGIIGRETFGFGIWKSVYILPVISAAITQLVPHTFYAGGHPTTILSDDEHMGFDVRVRVLLWAPKPTSGEVLINLLGVANVSSHVSLLPGSNNFTLTIPSKQTVGVRLWHPRGNGEQVRYNITASFIARGASGIVASTWRSLGFRHIALVTFNDTNASEVAAAQKQDGTGQLGMFFRVNGAAIYARGGNKIPMDLLDGRLSATAHWRLVKTAAEGNMNMLRVWGGGIWEPRAFFDACDEFGVMVFLDMQFTWGSVDVPGGADEIVRRELEYQLQRLSHHPSISILDACNECHGRGLYESFVMPTVAAVDQSRPIWPSCPSGGWAGGVDRLTGRSNGKKLVVRTGMPERPPFPFPLEGHGPYIGLGQGRIRAGHAGEGARSPEEVQKALCDASTIPTASPALTGPQYESWFRSEFGCVAWSSFESISAQLPEDQWSLQSKSSYLRNWPVFNVIESFFGKQDFSATGEVAFKRQLYQSMLGQALFLKNEIEAWRSTNNFGTTIWMFNEIWPTGGWGSVEYGGSTPGQVSGGRWKPLQYFFEASVFADNMATCNTRGACFVTNDSPRPFQGTVTVTLINAISGMEAPLTNKTVDLPAGAGIKSWFCASSIARSGAEPIDGVTSSLEGPKPSYHEHINVVPDRREDFNKELNGPIATCEAACDADEACVGFTRTSLSPSSCWLYSTVTALTNAASVDWYQKPGTAPIPAPPSPLDCEEWDSTKQWKALGCDANGANCLLTVQLRKDGTLALASSNVLPFQPPKAMRLPSASVTVAAGALADGRVPLKLSTTATALYVTLTTKVAGRFSQNAFLLRADAPTPATYFIPWGEYGSAEEKLLNESLRVEHLAENLAQNREPAEFVI